MAQILQIAIDIDLVLVEPSVAILAPLKFHSRITHASQPSDIN